MRGSPVHLDRRVIRVTGHPDPGFLRHGNHLFEKTLEPLPHLFACVCANVWKRRQMLDPLIVEIAQPRIASSRRARVTLRTAQRRKVVLNHGNARLAGGSQALLDIFQLLSGADAAV